MMTAVIAGWAAIANMQRKLERLWAGVVFSQRVLLALSKPPIEPREQAYAIVQKAACPSSAWNTKAAIFAPTSRVMLKSAASQYRPSAKACFSTALHQAQAGVDLGAAGL